jgi:hypothetical protein
MRQISIRGFVVKSFGYNTGFLGLGVIAAAGMLFFALLMPETKDYRREKRSYGDGT